MITRRETTLVRKKQIVSAAKKLILKYGSENVTVRRMANEIGVSEGAIYRHFESKTEILSFLLDDVENALVIKNRESLSNNAISNLEDMLMSQIASIKQRKGMSFQIIAEIISLGDKKLSRQAYEVISKFIEQIKGSLSDGIKTGLIRPDIDIEAVSILLFGMIQGLVTIWTLSHYRLDLEQKYQYLWIMFRKSIAQN